jgi:23S rRNA (guanosine2251-2'-O)-methyltransferase
MSEYVIGRNAVLELLKSGTRPEKIFIQRGEKKGSIHVIIAMAREKRIQISEISQERLTEMTASRAHQGVAALVTNYVYYSLDEIVEEARRLEEDPFLVLLDGIEDPHNLGAIIRTCEAAGVHGVVIPERRSATVNQTVHKTSAGATAYVKVCKVKNLNDTIAKLKDMGLWIFGMDAAGTIEYTQADFEGAVAVVIGGEGKGLSKLVAKNCDFLTYLPMKGQLSSLNASASAAVIIYEVLRRRNGAL